MGAESDAVAGISFDLFGTLVTVDRTDDPANAIAQALEAEGVSVPADWPVAFREQHVGAPDGAEIPLTDHVEAALASREDGTGRATSRTAIERAVDSAFDTEVRSRDGAAETVETLSERLPVGILSNCSVRGLAERAIQRSSIDVAAFDTVTTSVGCGWRKPDPRAFHAVAEELDVDVEGLLHVGDDSVTDGGAVEAGATAIFVDETPLRDVPEVVEEWA